jgi:hypothetical protein
MTASQERPYRYRVMLDTEPPVTFDSAAGACAYLATRGYDLSCQPSPGIVVYTCGDLCAAILRVRAEFPSQSRADESAKCPYCGDTFYAMPLHDPLKHHIQYCDKRPEDDE